MAAELHGTRGDNTMKEEIEVYRGSGNFFADLELPDAEEMREINLAIISL